MPIPVESPDSVEAYIASFPHILDVAPRICPLCGGFLKGHGHRCRWVVSLEGVFRVPIQRMICKVCRSTFPLLPRILFAFYSCTRRLADRVKSLWEKGKRKMAAVRHIITKSCSSLELSLSTLYRWARHPNWEGDDLPRRVPAVILSGMKPDAKEIKKRIDLVEYICSLGIDLKSVGAGEEYRGLCPFHEEGEPSFHVNRKKGLWHCFGCGAGGDVISFVMKRSKVGFQEALVILAGAGIKKQGGILEAVANYWHACLPSSASARRYLERRGIGTSELIERYQIGFAPGGTKTRDRLLSSGFTLDEIKTAGLVNRRGLDAFFGRVTFPLAEGGKVINVYGRSLSNRYRHMYLPGSRDVIFNIENVRGDSAVLTESIIDALSLMALGVGNAVSSMTVNLAARQVKILVRRFSRIAIVFDGDASGQAGARTARDSLSRNGIKARIIDMPAGSDINSLLVSGAGSFVVEKLFGKER